MTVSSIRKLVLILGMIQDRVRGQPDHVRPLFVLFLHIFLQLEQSVLLENILIVTENVLSLLSREGSVKVMAFLFSLGGLGQKGQ